jgi:hypothetical protein
MFITAVVRILYRTRLSRHPIVVNVDIDTQLSWTSNILWLKKEGKNDVSVSYDNKALLENEVNTIIQLVNDIEKKNTTDKLIYYLQMREEERKRWK